MAAISRRTIARYIADHLVNGTIPRSQLFAQVAAYMSDRKILNQVDLLVRDVEAALAREYGVVLTEIVSARELSNGIVAQIEQFVSRAENAKQVEVSTSIDPSLLGGVIIRTPRAQLDASVRKQLNDLKV